MGKVGMVTRTSGSEIGIGIGAMEIDNEGIGEAGEEGIESVPSGVGLFLLLFGGGGGTFSFWTFLFTVYTLLGLLAAISKEASLTSSSNFSS